MNYFDRRYPPERAEHEHDLRRHEPRFTDLPPSQRDALLKLIGYSEGLVAGGQLGELVEAHLRTLIAESLSAFGLPSKAEMEAAHA